MTGRQRRAGQAADLIQELCLDLEPVRPIAPLRRAGLLLTGLWLAIAVPLTVWPGANAVGNPGFLPTFGCLMLLATGSACAALGASVPGRQDAERVGQLAGLCGGIGILGLVFDQGIGEGLAQAFPSASLHYGAAALYYDWFCVGLAVLLALPIWISLLAFGRRGWIAHTRRVAVLASVASVAAGALLVHALCAEGCARHALGSHGLAPVWGSALLSLPALLALRNRARSPR